MPNEVGRLGIADGAVRGNVPMPCAYPLRDYQQECVDIIDANPTGAHLIQMATGLGKTVTFSRIDRSSGRVLILSHRDELVHQPIKYYPPGTVEVEQAGEHASLDAEVVSASVQTMSRRLDRFPRGHFDTIITDECHHAKAKSYKKIIEHFRPRRHLGFTATPARGDKKGLDDVYDDIIYRYDILRGIRNGWLCDLDCRQVEVSWDTSTIKRTNGDYAAGELARAVNTPQTNAQVAEAYERWHDGPTLLFAASVDHANELADLIDRSAVVTGSTPREERRQVIEAFRDGEIECLINCMVFTEGTDMPWVRTILLARPTQSDSLYAQMVGRGLRPYEGKGSCLLLDCVGAARDRRLCTPATLVGMDKERFPECRKNLEEGLLSQMADRVEEAEDLPLSWVLMEHRIDLTSSRLAWVSMPDRSRWIAGDDFSFTMSAPDHLGAVTVTAENHKPGNVSTVTRAYASEDEADEAVEYWLGMCRPQVKWIWDAEQARRQRCLPASAKQLGYISRLLGVEAYEELADSIFDREGRGLTKREAAVVISQAKRRADESLYRDYGACPVCGRPMRASKGGKSVYCSSNRWDNGKLVAGCGFSIYLKQSEGQLSGSDVKRLVSGGFVYISGVPYLLDASEGVMPFDRLRQASA